MQTWQRWTPALLFRGNVTKSKQPAVGYVQVVLATSGTIAISPPAWDMEATTILAQQQQFRQYRRGVMAAVARRDSLAGAGAQVSAGEQATITEENFGYEFSSAGINWVNCDRFLDAAQPLFVFKLAEKDLEARTMLVLRKTMTVLSGQVNMAEGVTTFGRVPLATEATVVALRWRQGQAEIAMQPVMLSREIDGSPLQYHAVTLLDLQAALANL